MKAVPTLSSPRVLAGYLGLAVRSIRDHGARDILRDLWSELVFDWRNGVDTLVPREIAAHGIPPSVLSDAVRYQGVSPRLFQDLLDHLPPEARDATFVDFGCGKGRALFLAAAAGFRRLVGVEIDGDLLAKCRSNLTRSGRRSTLPPVELRHQDAAEFEPPAGPLVAFFYNPFAGLTLARVARRLAMHGTRDVVWVMYVNPRLLATFADAGFATRHIHLRRHRAAAALLVTGP